MNGQLYEQSFVRLHEVLGRTYNNPLGASPFPLLRRLLAGKAHSRVLDVGCGRGETSCWWAAQASATVDAFDPSPAMLASARALVTRRALQDQVRLSQADIRSFTASAAYDLVLAHDVLCYSQHMAADLERLLGFLAHGGVASLTGYYADSNADEVRSVASNWGIQPPPSYQEICTLATRTGVSVLLMADTTRQYETHWVGVQRTLADRLVEAERVAGCDETAAFSARIAAILQAVRGGRFGHWWSILSVDCQD